MGIHPNTVQQQSAAYIPPHHRTKAYSHDKDIDSWNRPSSSRPSWRDEYSDYDRPKRGWSTRSSSSSSFGNQYQFDERGSYGGYRPRGNYQRYQSTKRDHSGHWRDGVHRVGPRNPHVERELFGTAEDKKILHIGINFDKYDNIPIEVSGKDVPPLIEEFTSPPMDTHLLSNIELARYTKPTPVQKASIPIVINHRDLMACAQTGSGKTAGFLFPILSSMFEKGPTTTGIYRPHKAYPEALVLAPTRELASQIFEEAKKFAYRSWVRPCVAYGGADIGQQLRQISYGCDVLVATPGRLVDLIERARISLAKVRFLILDEADRMLDMGFEPQIRRIVQGEDMPDANHRQTLMFSATFPKNIQILAHDFLKDYIFLSVGRVGATSENITQKFEYVEDQDKRSVLLDILSSAPQKGLTLIFVETKRMADTLSDFLIHQRFPVTSIHGDRSQRERENALEAFRSGKAPIMVATAVAARGLDIPNVTHVISYDLPTDIDDYVHRIGRTGRAGNVGVATAFFNRGNKNMARDLIDLLKEAKQDIPHWLEGIVRETYSRRGGRGRGRGVTRDYRVRHHEYRGSNKIGYDDDYPTQHYASSYGGGTGYVSRQSKTSWF
ncbi:P-loop containing nucleoside triphosphate hydrolase protein [Gilbertella persicaria]|uniref:P-loop containing nucleoside triphosphate hydrolase protein n=1 Tax=Gilbertella persicaria TaxID=101096 RepID=UPI00221F199C|nr:P-loop containing nucleoside triphosphate hydrolase protein [Gilbertella persicaria]KAI8073453.1 P-loop containing nucleoside triphosphate hydrolase protein [Gilbertella persicaria]